MVWANYIYSIFFVLGPLMDANRPQAALGISRLSEVMPARPAITWSASQDLDLLEALVKVKVPDENPMTTSLRNHSCADCLDPPM